MGGVLGRGLGSKRRAVGPTTAFSCTAPTAQEFLNVSNNTCEWPGLTQCKCFFCALRLLRVQRQKHCLLQYKEICIVCSGHSAQGHCAFGPAEDAARVSQQAERPGTLAWAAWVHGMGALPASAFIYSIRPAMAQPRCYQLHNACTLTNNVCPGHAASQSTPLNAFTHPSACAWLPAPAAQ